jgi:hypothetical protein
MLLGLLIPPSQLGSFKQENSVFLQGWQALYLGHPKFQDVFMDDPLSNHCMKF